MIQFTNSIKLNQFSIAEKQKGSTIGFVPTMGALHDGHLSLIREARKNCDIVVCSIFVNPTQFNNKSDLENYPIDIEGDIKLLEKENCDVVFIPTVSEMYPKNYDIIKIDLSQTDKYLEGEHRPGHFDGVVTIVNKLFNIVEPHKAFFGQKDFQQFCIIKKMASQLNNKVEVIMCPTVREKDGLAMSSRNRRLSPENRKKATIIYKSLINVAKNSSKLELTELKQQLNDELKTEANLKLDYAEIADVNTLEPIISWENRNEVQAFVAAYFGEVRLIDNMKLSRK